MSIKIGDNNIIKNSSFNNDETKKKKWPERHPIIISVICSFVVGFMLLFSFWQDIVLWIEGIF
jgi:hypothetical protein